MAVFSFLLLALTAVLAAAQSKPNIPLQSSSRWILDGDGNRVKFRCVNWAGHMETHLPEGLNKQPISYLAKWIADQGFNCVRLTYSIDWALSPDTSVQDAFTNAAGLAGVPVSNMTTLYNQAVQQNPFLATANTRDAYAAVIAALWDHGIMTVLDNHVSKASWCCDLTDGNGWWDTAFGYNSWNSQYFVTSDWLAGLQATAAWASSQPGVVAMSLRNEMRQFLLQGTNGPYNDWYSNVETAASLIHNTNPDLLIVVGGVSSATDLSSVRLRPLDTSPWAGKHVWEFHAYSFTVTFKVNFGSCDVVQQEYGGFDGFVLEQGEAFTGPLWLSEFGVGMTGGPDNGLTSGDSSYLSCLVNYMTTNDADWAVWALQGSYYVRSGQVEYDEGYGLLDSTWTTWRNPAFPGMLGAMWNVTQGP